MAAWLSIIPENALLYGIPVWCATVEKSCHTAHRAVRSVREKAGQMGPGGELSAPVEVSRQAFCRMARQWQAEIWRNRQGAVGCRFGSAFAVCTRAGRVMVRHRLSAAAGAGTPCSSGWSRRQAVQPCRARRTWQDAGDGRPLQKTARPALATQRTRAAAGSDSVSLEPVQFETFRS